MPPNQMVRLGRAEKTAVATGNFHPQPCALAYVSSEQACCANGRRQRQASRLTRGSRQASITFCKFVLLRFPVENQR
jgi:hypothetical protein